MRSNHASDVFSYARKSKYTAVPALAAAAAVLVTLAAARPAAAQGPDPEIIAGLTDVLLLDLDGDGLFDEGDRIRYVATLGTTSVGGTATAAVFDLDLDPHGPLVAGTVTTTHGTVLEGNAPGDTRVRVALGDLPPGTLADVTFEATIDDPVPAAVDHLVCQGTIAGSNFPPLSTDDPTTSIARDATLTPLDFDPDLALVKDDGGAVAGPGDLVVYTLAFGNLSTRETASGAALHETVPQNSTFAAGGSSPGWSCPDGAPAGSMCSLPLGTLPPGAAGTRAFAVRVDDPLPAGVSEIANLASIADDGTHGPDRDPADNQAADSTPVGGPGAAPDLVLGKDDGGAVAAPGMVVTYTLSYANAGNRGAAGVVLTDTVPDHTTFASIASSPAWSCPNGAPAGTPCTLALHTVPAGTAGVATFAVRVDDPLPAGVTEILNAAGITDDGTNGTDPDPSNNFDGEMTPVGGAGAGPDLALLKDDGGALAAPGAVVAYSLTYRNDGNRGATGVVLTDTLPLHATLDTGASTPGWTCPVSIPADRTCTLAVGGVPVGAVATATLAVRVDSPLPAGVVELVDVASIADDGTNGADLDPANNTDSETTPVGGPGAAPDLALGKSDGGAVAAPGDPITYTLSFENLGTRGASGVVLTDTVPADTTFVPIASSPGWSCPVDAPEGTPCTLALGTLEAGDAATATFTVRVVDPVPAGRTLIANSASVTDDGTNGADPDLGNNQAADTTPLDLPSPGPDLDAFLIDTLIDQDGDGEAGPGDVVSYTVTIGNAAGTAGLDVAFLASAPARTALQAGSVTTTHGTVVEGNAPGDLGVRVEIGTLPAETAVVTFEVAIDDPLPPGVDEIVAQGTVTGTNFEPLATDDPDTPALDDPTRTPLAGGEGGPSPVDVPTLGWPGLVALAAVLVLFAARRLRRASDAGVGGIAP